MKRWTPSSGATALRDEFGVDAALDLLASLLSGEAAPAEFAGEPWSTVLRLVGNYRSPRDGATGDAGGTPLDLQHEGNEYWARSWAARAMAYIGDERVASSLARALNDHHWRVRMTAAQTIGRLRIRGLDDELVRLLDDEHGRVRDAAALALERTA